MTWLLITGAPGSGTSLLRALVDDHPQAAILQEFGLTRLVRSLAALAGRPAPVRSSWRSFAEVGTALGKAAAFYDEREAAGGVGARRDLGAVPLEALAQGLLGALNPSPPRVVGGQAPLRGAWEDVDHLLRHAPGLRVLVALRNPRAVINSSMIRRARQQAGGDAWPIASVQEAAEEWWLAWRKTAELAGRLGDAVRLVKYETLCGDVGDVLGGVWDWLGLPAHAPATVVRRLPGAIDALRAEEAGVVDALLGEVVAAWDEEPDPVGLLARFPDLPRPYVPGRRLEAASEEADAILVEGFSWREPWGRWTDGERAVIRLRHGLDGGWGVLELQVARVFAPEGAACDVVVRVEGARPELFSLGEGRSRLALPCPLRAVHAPGVLEAELLVLRPKTLLDAPADDRRLGVGLESISLRVLP